MSITFSLQTLLALLASVALALSCARSAVLGIAVMVAILPIALVIIGLTSPQRGNQLDPSERWYFFLIAKIWVFTLGFLVVGTFLFALAPSLRVQAIRILNGDLRRHQIVVFFPGDRQASDSLNQKEVTLYDSKGLIGEVREIGCIEKIQNGRQTGSLVWLLVSTDRREALKYHQKTLAIDTGSDGSLTIRD